MQDIIQFFDSHAKDWDSYWQEEEFVLMHKILDRSGIQKEDMVLDIACGTGILVPFYLESGIQPSRMQGIDISPKMVEIFSHKFPDIPVLCDDFLSAALPENFFSYAMIFNSFPHFMEPERVFAKVAEILKPKGKLIIAHTKTREALDMHHERSSSVVKSHRLIEDSLFLKYYEKYGFIDIVLDNDFYFYTMGIKK